MQFVLDDAAQIQTTLQNFSSVLTEMSQVCNVTALQEELDEANLQVATVKDSFTAPLAQLEHAAVVSLRFNYYLLLLSFCFSFKTLQQILSILDFVFFDILLFISVLVFV